MGLIEELLGANEFCKFWGGESEHGSPADMCLIAAREIERLTAENERLVAESISDMKSFEEQLAEEQQRTAEAREAARWLLVNADSPVYDDGQWVTTHWPWLDDKAADAAREV